MRAVAAAFLVGLIVGVVFSFVGFFHLATPSKSSGPEQLVTRSITVSTTSPTGVNAIVSYCFSPGGDCAQVVVSWILRANSSIHIMIYEFTLQSIANALIQVHKQKPQVDIRIVWDQRTTNEESSQFNPLKAAGLNMDVRVNQMVGLMHDKVAIVDGHIIITGSFNWTWSANEANSENLVVLDSSSVGQAYEQDFNTVWSESMPS